MNKALLLVTASLAWSLNSFAGAGADEPIKATFSMNPAGSIVAHTRLVTGGIIQQKDGSFAAPKIEIPLATLTTDNNLRDQHMRDKYLEIKKFPKAILTGLAAKGGKFNGKLTLHGITAPVEGEYKISGNHVVASFPLKLEDYKIKIPTYLGVGVEDEGSVEVNLPFTK